VKTTNVRLPYGEFVEAIRNIDSKDPDCFLDAEAIARMSGIYGPEQRVHFTAEFGQVEINEAYLRSLGGQRVPSIPLPPVSKLIAPRLDRLHDRSVEMQRQVVVTAFGTSLEILPILALRQNRVDAPTSAALKAWHANVLILPLTVEPHEGPLADIAVLRDALFKTYLDREFDIDRWDVSKRTLKLCVYAVAMGDALGRAANRRHRTRLS
jgi:hypothetical protein